MSLRAVGIAALLTLVTTAAVAKKSPDGKQLFEHRWKAGDPLAASGDGLGPLFNADSCVACHNQGGVGGAGNAEANVTLLPGRGVVHAKSTNKSYDGVRNGWFEPPNLHGEFMCGTAMMHMMDQFTPRFRQTPALFGIGLLDGVTEADLIAAQKAGESHEGISGRIARDQAGQPGRFGWKGQTSSVSQFVENACANELGLTTASAVQPDDPSKPRKTEPGIDLDVGQVAALTHFVATLPAPKDAPDNHAGRSVFRDVGCTGCHAEQLGAVKGAYTDLLLHDMGHGLSDDALGYGFDMPTSETMAQGNEWRTPPLWGLADSAPYLHDGRAETVDNAILQHAGEADASRLAYEALSDGDRSALLSFLGSLGG